MLKNRLLSGGAWALGGRLASALAMVASNVLLARILSPRDLGVYFLAYSIVALGAYLGSLGLNSAVVRFVAESMGLDQPAQTRRMINLTLGFGATGALAAGLAYFLFSDALAIGLFRAPALAAIAGLVAGWIIVTSFQGLLAETFRGFHDIRLATIFNNFGGPVSGAFLVIALALVYFSERQAPLTTIVLLAAGSSCASALLAGLLLRRKVGSLPTHGAKSRASIGGIWRVSWPLWITSIVLFAFTQADLWMVGAFLPQDEVALYGAAARMVLLVAMPIVIVDAVAQPLIAEMYAQGKRRELERILRNIAALAGVPAFAALAVFALLGEPILGLLFGDYYREAASVLVVLSLGQWLGVWVGSCGYALMMTGNQKTMMAITVFCGALTVAAGLITVREYGMIGVAASMAAGRSLQCVLMLLGARFTIGIWTHMSLKSLPELLRTVRG